MKINQYRTQFFLSLFLLFATVILNGQVATSSVTLNDTLYLVDYVHTDGMHTVKFKNQGAAKHTASTPEFTPTFLRDQLSKVYLANLGSTNTPADIESTLREQASALYIDLLYTYANEKEAQGQQIAELTFNKSVPVYLDVDLSEVAEVDTIIDGGTVTAIKYIAIANEYTGLVPSELTEVKRRFRKNKYLIHFEEEFTPQRCDIVFEDGFISSVIVRGVLFGKKVAFSSQVPIGITTRNNILNLTNHKLYNELSKSNYYIKLGEVITYERLNDELTKDHSPKNGRIILNENIRSKTLYKEPVNKLFHVNVFSDFVGLNEDNPNGLVQIEIDKRISLRTKRNNSGWGWLTHLTPSFVLSKIEENNRTLPVSLFTDSEGQVTKYTSPLEVFRYSQMQTTFALNIFDYYGSAFDIEVNLLPGLTITQLVDSVSEGNTSVQVREERINSPLLGGELKLDFRPEKAFGFGIRSRSFYYWNLNANAQFNSPNGRLEGLSLSDPNRLLHDISLLVTIRAGENSDNLFFARLGMVHEWSNLDNNFAQVQLGFSTYLKTSRKK